jgi:hypothetical protein
MGWGIATSSFVQHQDHIQIIISSLEMKLLLELFLIPVAVLTAVCIAYVRGWATFSLKFYPHFKYYAYKDIIIKEFRAGFGLEVLAMIMAALFVSSSLIVPIQLAVIGVSMLVSGSMSYRYGTLNQPVV